MSSNVSLINAIVMNIDLTQVNQKLIPLSTNVRFIPNYFIIENIGCENITQIPLISIGTNNPDFNNLISLTELTYINNLFTPKKLELISEYKSIYENQEVYVNIITPMIADVCNVNITCIGFYY